MGQLLTPERFETTLKYWNLFEQGLICTLLLSALTVIFGFIIAMILALMRLSNFRPFAFLERLPVQGDRLHATFRVIAKFNPLRFIAAVYVEFVRSTPMLVQLFIIYYVVFSYIDVPYFNIISGVTSDRFIPGVVALALNSGGYLSEIIRGGIEGVALGQTEAARSLGLPKGKTMRLIVLPQAIKNILPAIANEFVTIIKESSITYTIGVQDIMYAVTVVRGSAWAIAEPLVIATLLYFCLCFPTSKLIAYFERRMSHGDKR